MKKIVLAAAAMALTLPETQMSTLAMLLFGCGVVGLALRRRMSRAPAFV